MKHLLVSILFLLSLCASADTVIPDMKFRRLDTRDGLSNSQVNVLYQDSKGFVWIGTSYGLNRYDGYRFCTYYSDPNDTTTLRNNYVDLIFEDEQGRLWLKQGMNYAIFDPVTEEVVRNPSTELVKYGITGGIDRIYVDSKKNIWVKNYDEGLFCYNPKTKAKTLTRYGYDENTFPKEFWFSSFAEYENLLLVASSDGDLMAVDGAKGKVVWKDSYIRQHGGAASAEYRIIVDQKGIIWVLSAGYVFIYDQKQKKWYNSANEFLLSKGIDLQKEGLMIWDLMTDQRGWLWLATDHEGLIVVDTKSKEIRQFVNNKFDETSLSENTVKHLLLDHSGNMWIGAYRNGINQYIEKLSGLKTMELGDINATTEDRAGYYWLGTDNKGAIRYDPKTGDTEVFDKARCGFASDIIVSAYGASDGSVWLGTYNGGMMRLKDGHSVNYTATGASDGLLNNNVWSITEDKWGNIWIGTLGNGVQKLDLKTGKFRTWSSYNTSLKENFMTTANWISKGWLMVGHSQFYSLINPVNGKVINVTIPAIPGQPAAMNSTTCVMEDSRGLVWHGSTAGCCIIDAKSGKQTMIDMNSGLFGSSVLSIVEDLLHTMWVVTEHGVSNVVPQRDEHGDWTFVVRSFSSKDGLQQGPYNQRSACCTHDGLILVGGLGGLDIINPKLLTNISNQETPVFSGLKLYGQQMRVGQEYEGRVILKKALNECRELVLRYDENQFTIQLGTDKGEAHNPSRFIYQLEGFSDKWIKTEETDPNITYMSLHHGSYTLHVRMLNDDGTMGEKENTLEITITPPLWRTRWMMLLYILAVLAIAILWRRRFLRQHQERTELEAIRLEVEKKRWMSEIRSQMIREEENKEEAKVFRQEEPEWEVSTLNKQSADLQLFMKEQCNQFKSPDDKQVKFSFFPLADDLMVSFDHDLLAQAVQILLNNAVMFSPHNCRIKVFVDKTKDAGMIRISDNGIGLPEGSKEHMFDQEVGDEDSGICLYIVKSIVDAHGGTVVGDNNPGGGTQFTITLPLGPDKSDEVEEAVLMDDESK